MAILGQLDLSALPIPAGGERQAPDAADGCQVRSLKGGLGQGKAPLISDGPLQRGEGTAATTRLQFCQVADD